jgi:hypothetical protein
MSFRNDNHSRIRSASCKDTPGSILKFEAFLYIHTQLPSGGLVALRMRISDGQVLRCYQRLRRASCTGIRARLAAACR